MRANLPDGAAGEIGTFQILPSTAPGVNLRDLQTNITTGVNLLATYLGMFGGSVQAAIAAFNCGPNCVSAAMSRLGSAWLSAIPASTQSYVAAIFARIQNDYSATINVASLISPLTAGFAAPPDTSSGAGGTPSGMPVWTQAAIAVAVIFVVGWLVSE